MTYIPVDGAVSFPSEEIVAASNLAGNHIFSADPGQAAANIAALPGVISSTVSLEWPNQVYIEISEEEPVAVWQENGSAYGITGSGRLIPSGFPLTGLLQIIPETGSEAVTSSPVTEEEILTEETSATAAEETSAVAEETVVDRAADEAVEPQTNSGTNGDTNELEEVKAALETSIIFVPQEVLAGALSLRKLRPSINELYYRPSGGLSYQDERGWRVHFGTGTDMNQKLVLYETILDELLTRGVSPRYISVSNKSKPYYLAH